MSFPSIQIAQKLNPNKSRLFIGAYGFEDRRCGWSNYQKEQGKILKSAILFKYVRPKGDNKIIEIKKSLNKIGILRPIEINYDVMEPSNIENNIRKKLKNVLDGIEEVIVDISTMTKLSILVCLCKLVNFNGTLRIIYTEAKDYAPTKKEYEEYKESMKKIAKFPSQGFETIIRVKCLSSIRMQGQPVTMIAFTSFNEQLISHMMGTINPHRLLFINGRPPRKDFSWREIATYEIYKELIEEYPAGNPINKEGLLERVASTLDYKDTIDNINEIYNKYGNHERIICTATGSKMQTVGLFFSKMLHPDIHIEYPTPDSYFVKRTAEGIQQVHEIVIKHFSEFIKNERLKIK
ncbi:hypothetical protein HY745_10720 [Candidatus Desantisbacteria bacterium]|nr:hypothetical protein [Candidatus Desantisbacteria bacterium]